MAIIIWFLIPIFSVAFFKRTSAQIIATNIISLAVLWASAIRAESKAMDSDFDIIFAISMLVFSLLGIGYNLFMIYIGFKIKARFCKN